MKALAAHLFVITLLGCTDAPPKVADAPTLAGALRPDWATAFAAEGAVGTFVLYDPSTGTTQRYNPARAAERFCPASTFKVYNSLVVLDAGAVRDVDSLFAWDGTERSVPAWNRDHSLRSGMRYSTVWLFQRLARAVGRERYASAFAKTAYGNGTVGEAVDLFWLDGSLRISADEQVLFLDALRQNRLAFPRETQAQVLELMPVLAKAEPTNETNAEASDSDWRLLGKTGLGLPPDEAQIGWLVGYYVHAGDTLVYAMNAIAAEGQTFDAVPGRQRIVEAVLRGEGYSPP